MELGAFPSAVFGGKCGAQFKFEQVWSSFGPSPQRYSDSVLRLLVGRPAFVTSVGGFVTLVLGMTVLNGFLRQLAVLADLFGNDGVDFGRHDLSRA